MSILSSIRFKLRASNILTSRWSDLMQKSLRIFSVNLLLLLLCSSAFAGQYTSDFPDYLAGLDDGQEMVSAIVTMADRVDLRALQDRLYAEGADRRAWHEAVVLALQDKAAYTQADIIARLDEMVASGQVEKYQQHWIGNVISVSAATAALDELVARQDVHEIAPDYLIETIKPVVQDDEPLISGHEIGLERIHATEVWALGITGQGRLVSNIDTGVLGSHEALSARWAGNDPRYEGHPEWAWLDPYTTNWPTPNDVNGHGTHTMGTICGRSDGGDTIGVAIEAQWIAAAAIDRGGGIPRTVSDAILSFEWIADPDSNPATVWDVPDVCSNSWGVTTGHGYPPCDETFWTVIDGCEAVGVVVVFAAGNEGPDSSTLRRPADRASTPVTTFSVGAVDGNNPNLPIADFSSRGPSSCTPDGLPTFKPEVVAPGVNVRSSYDNGGYTTLSGTSMACPHVAGVVALIRQANPNLTSEQVKQVMLDTADDLGGSGEDNTYGVGVVNAYEAVLLAISYLQGWGALAGVITDQATGNPIVGATITVQDRPWNAVSRAGGVYSIFLPADTAWAMRVDFSPTHLPIFDTVTVVENDTIFQDYALEGKVNVTLKASFANPLDASYRPFYIRGSWDADGFWDASWSAPPLEIRDNGIAPDQVAEDGIFTGNAMLARDLVHTYAWAVYSENYGGDAARLQNGADFQILDLNPPVVPTLAVNPSGSDNNWVVTAFGDNGLNLDLAQGINNDPFLWGAATPLDSGIVYTFRLRVMHSTVASYGIGGIGGPDITFNCQFTGSYDFILDDSDDSYLVQLTGTEGPPTSLVAVSGLDSHIRLNWVSPVLRDVLAGYNLYRSTSANPYNGGDIAYRVNGTNLITATEYDDWAGVLDSIQNGVLYYYQAAAVYDIGSGQFVEVGPSNEATGTAQNHPPYPPYDVQGSVDDRTIYVSWSFGDSARDLAHYNVFKRLMPQGQSELVGSPENQDFSFDIPIGEDGVYQVTVTAVDDGDPQLESGPSRPLYLAIGHLPPSSLTATSGEEFRVPLHWTLPGSWRIASASDPPVENITSDSDLPDEMLKGMEEPIGPPMTLGRGGPDAFGYEWIDSDEPDGPFFGWIDITGNGTEITPWPHGTVDDGYTDPILMGMSFEFYGVIYDSIVITTNGWISFLRQTSSHLSNEAIPNSTTPQAIVAVEWDDLDGGTVGHCFYYYDPSMNEFIVSWIGWPYYPDPTDPHDIQVILSGNAGTITTQYRNGTAWQSDVTVGIENETGTDGLQVTYNQSYLHNDMAISYSTGPEGIAPAHFNLYRSQSPNVPIEPAYLITGDLPGTVTNYVDSYEIQNGVTYYYRLTAVWPDSIESPPTNEASATPANHLPLPPYGLQGSVFDRTISILWSHDDPVGDLDHFNVYKRLMPNGSLTFVGSATDTSYSFDIPIGEDGIYVITVTAVDNGTPELESGYADEILLPVGHLPPNNLTAESGYESSVPLNWTLPGAWRTGLSDTPSDPIIASLPGNIPSTYEAEVDEIALRNNDEPIGPPMILGRGGPDAFGYEWVDSDEPDGPVFNWVDITSNGTEITPWPHGTVDNGYTDLFPMGMDFEFYGITYSDIVVGTNGWISFQAQTLSHLANEGIPNSTTPQAIVAVEWDDLDGGTVGHCYYYYDSAQNRFIVSWVNWPYYPDPTDPRDFQVILYGYTGKIITQYQNGTTWQSDVTVGIENETGTDGLQVTYNQAYLHNDLAIRFSTGSEGFQPVHYNLYRNTTPNFPIGPSYLINGSIGGDQLTYTDTSDLQNGTAYYYKLTAVWPDSMESPPSNEASATPTWGASMVLNPLSFDVTGEVGQITTSNLNISNPGGLDLSYSILAQTDNRIAGAPGNDNAVGIAADIGSPEDATDVETKDAKEPISPPMLLGRGGPDAFGYIWIDSDELDGPRFDWIDITGVGVEISPWPHGTVDDGYTDLIPMGMDFTFYGITYSDIVVSTNGWISFLAQTSSHLSNEAIPNNTTPQAIVAVEWDDLDGGTVGHCYYYYDAALNQFIVSWVGWPYYPDPTDPRDIQIILNGNGSIITQYANGSTWQSDVTVGIENETGTDGLQVTYNQPYLHNDMAILYSTGWLSTAPTSGTVPPGGNQDVSVIFDATLLDVGVYTGSLVVTGADIHHQVGQVTIPVTFHVIPTSVDEGTTELPREFALSQNYPNPFNPSTEISFALPVRSHVELRIYNVLGQKVRTLVDTDMEAGYKSVVWNGSDGSGSQVSSGTYFYLLDAGGKTFSKKMTLIK